MEFYVDGGCRGNGQPGVIGAAANSKWKSQHLPRYPTPTNQRAEITAIIIALEWTLEIMTIWMGIRV
ncbi:hypothetical protein F4824DRAFT_506163 [Ustulina deusta]|nr:hypothetical protein F4824DRAFT_506163 [Ustulina deusta]